MPHQMPQQAPMPQLQVPMPPMLPMPRLPGQHVPGIPLRGTLSMALPGVEEMAVIADDDMNRSLGLENIDMVCSLAHKSAQRHRLPVLDLNDMSLSEGTRAEVERALTSAA